jgi:hypothetical protein
MCALRTLSTSDELASSKFAQADDSINFVRGCPHHVQLLIEAEHTSLSAGMTVRSWRNNYARARETGQGRGRIGGSLSWPAGRAEHVLLYVCTPVCDAVRVMY